MSIWRNRKKELRATNETQAQETEGIFHPVATCSHVDQNTSDKPSCSGQPSSSSTFIATIADDNGKKAGVEKEENVVGSSPKSVKTSVSQNRETGSIKNEADVPIVMESSYRGESDGAVVIFGEVVQFHKRQEGDANSSDVKVPTSCDKTDDMRSLESDHEEPIEEEDVEENNLCSSPKEGYRNGKMSCGDSRLCNGSESSTECECQGDVHAGNTYCSKACHDKVLVSKIFLRQNPFTILKWSTLSSSNPLNNFFYETNN